MTKNLAAFATFAFAFAYPGVTAPFRGADAYCFFGLFFFLLLVPCFLWNWIAAGLFSQMFRGLVIDRHQQLALSGARYVFLGTVIVAKACTLDHTQLERRKGG